MTHSDDQGLVLPPKLAPTQVVIVPIYRKDGERELVLEYGDAIVKELKALGVRVKLDDRDNFKLGFKFAEHEARGIPLRIAIGPRDVQNGNVELARRDTLNKEVVSRDGIGSLIKSLLETIQFDLFKAAKTRREEMTSEVESYEEFKSVLEEKEDLFTLIGMAHQKPRNASKMKRRLPFAASHLKKVHLAPVW